MICTWTRRTTTPRVPSRSARTRTDKRQFGRWVRRAILCPLRRPDAGRFAYGLAERHEVQQVLPPRGPIGASVLLSLVVSGRRESAGQPVLLRAGRGDVD